MCIWCNGFITYCDNCEQVICNRCGYIVGTKEEMEMIDILDGYIKNTKASIELINNANELYDIIIARCMNHQQLLKCNERKTEKEFCIECNLLGYIDEE